MQAEVSGEGSDSGSLRELVRRLLAEHRDFASRTSLLENSIGDPSAIARITEVFVPLRDALVEHMLVEETEIFPEVSMRGLFTERVSEIMQQHLEITTALENMRFALHGKDREALRKAFEELSAVMRLHFPAEEREVFQLVV